MNNDGYREIVAAAWRGARPDPALRIDEWSEQHMKLPKDAARPGDYRIENTPMVRRILQVLSPDHPATRIVVRGASQMLKTQAALNFIAAVAHSAPKNILVLEPTQTLAGRISARIAQMIRNVDVLREIFAKPRDRDSRNTKWQKQFYDGHYAIHIATAGAAANLAEISARYMYVDEIDRMKVNVGGEGDSVLLAEVRMTSQPGAKALHTSSPTAKGASKIDALYDRGTQEVYLVPCPHCGHHHQLVVENFRYQRDEESGWMDRAWFVCPECGAEIDEKHKYRMLRDEMLGGTAHWHARSRGDGETVSFHVSAFYAPSYSIGWLKLAREYAYAKECLEQGDPGPMQVFYNTRLALSWSNAVERTTAQELMARADCIPRVLPEWALVVTIAVDTQGNRLEAQAEAWGPGLEHAVIDHQVLMGDPSEPPDTPGSCWAQLDEYRRTPWQHESGAVVYASVYGIDSAGSNTQDVYNYASARLNVGCIVLHGSTRPRRPIISSTPTSVDIDWRGQRVEGGVQLWSVGTDVAKDWLHNHRARRSGPGAMHFNTALTPDWYEQLLAESPVFERKRGGRVRVWRKATSSDRNEALDLAVYNLALAHRFGLHKWAAADWTKQRAKLIPKPAAPEPEALPQIPVAAAPAARPMQQQQHAGWGPRVLSRGLGWS